MTLSQNSNAFSAGINLNLRKVKNGKNKNQSIAVLTEVSIGTERAISVSSDSTQS